MNNSALHPEGKMAAESPRSCSSSITHYFIHEFIQQIFQPHSSTKYCSNQGPVRIRETKTYDLPGLRALSGVQDPKERMPLTGAQTTEEVVCPAAGAWTTKERTMGSLGYASCQVVGGRSQVVAAI